MIIIYILIINIEGIIRMNKVLCLLLILTVIMLTGCGTSSENILTMEKFEEI